MLRTVKTINRMQKECRRGKWRELGMQTDDMEYQLKLLKTNTRTNERAQQHLLISERKKN